MKGGCLFCLVVFHVFFGFEENAKRMVIRVGGYAGENFDMQTKVMKRK